MIENIPISRLLKLCNPFENSPWGVDINLEDVRQALNENRVIHDQESGDHAARIAYFVRDEILQPIEIDVGVPVCGFVPSWIIEDGNHRYAASIFKKKRYIKAVVSGEVDYIFKLLGVKIFH